MLTKTAKLQNVCYNKTTNIMLTKIAKLTKKGEKKCKTKIKKKNGHTKRLRLIQPKSGKKLLNLLICCFWKWGFAMFPRPG